MSAPSNTSSPRNKKYATHPSAYTSLRASAWRPPRASSGAKYAGVPKVTPSGSNAHASCANPKSRTVKKS